MVDDIDQDGYNEVVARTRRPEKPYVVYDWGDDCAAREINQLWPEAVSPELQEKLMTDYERYARLQEQAGRTPKEPSEDSWLAFRSARDEGA